MIPNCVSMFDDKGKLIADISDIDDCVLLLINNVEQANLYFDSIPDLYDRSGEHEYIMPIFDRTGIYGSYVDHDDNYTFVDITLYFEVLSMIMRNYPDKFGGGLSW